MLFFKSENNMKEKYIHCFSLWRINTQFDILYPV